MRALRCLAGLALFASGCCCGGQEYLTFGVSGAGTTTPLWGETMEWRGRAIVVSYPSDRELSGVPIEVYDGEDRVEVPSTSRLVDNSERHGCGESYDLEYDLSGLTAGSYTVIHRRSAGTGDPVNCLGDCPWTTFEGEDALELTLVLIE